MREAHPMRYIIMMFRLSGLDVELRTWYQPASILNYASGGDLCSSFKNGYKKRKDTSRHIHGGYPVPHSLKCARVASLHCSSCKDKLFLDSSTKNLHWLASLP